MQNQISTNSPLVYCGISFSIKNNTLELSIPKDCFIITEHKYPAEALIEVISGTFCTYYDEDTEETIIDGVSPYVSTESREAFQKIKFAYSTSDIFNIIDNINQEIEENPTDLSPFVFTFAQTN
jgi:hypothetical protein